jgi:hypothetical protein
MIGRLLVGSMLVAVGVVSTGAGAQSAQRTSAQLSVLGTAIDNGGNDIGGIGVEPQLRYNWLRSASRGVISIGIGGQFTQHALGPDDFTITGVFVEPRWVFPVNSERFAPYAALRIGFLNQSSSIQIPNSVRWDGSSSGPALGGGGGFAVRLTSRMNLDVGGAVVSQKFGAVTLPTRQVLFADRFITYAVKAGLTLGLGK